MSAKGARRFVAMSRKSLQRATTLLQNGGQPGLAVDALTEAAAWAKLAAEAVRR